MPRVNFDQKSYLYFKEISLESLNLHGDNQENENQSDASNKFAISLDDIYDNISLYEYDPNDRLENSKLNY